MGKGPLLPPGKKISSKPSGGLNSREVAYLHLTQQPQIGFPVFPIFFRGKIIDDAEFNQWRWLEESGQWLENVDRTHLVLAISKPVLQKSFLINFVSSSGHLWRHRSGGGSLHRGQRQRQQV